MLTGPPAGAGQGAHVLTYCSVVSVALLLSDSESATAPASPIRLFHRLHGVEVRDATPMSGERATLLFLLERRERRVDLERLRERHGARLADPVSAQTVARRGGSERRDSKAHSRSRVTYSSDVSVALILSASASAAAPASPIRLYDRLQRGRRVRD
jgi:hypothetical protein